MEVDVKQLEIVAAAFLSQDATLIGDIVRGIDLHCMSLATWKGESYADVVDRYKIHDEHTVALRTQAKGISFQLLYGSTAKGISNKFLIPLKEATAFIDNYYIRYQELYDWQQTNILEVDKNKTLCGMSHTYNLPVYTGSLKTPLNRELVFKTSEPPWDNPKKTTFTPTQIKNYPVQAFATGDLFQLLLGKIFRYVRQYYPTVLLINTVHDSIIFDIPGSIYRYGFAQAIKERAEQITDDLLTEFNIDMSPLSIQVDVEWGDNWDNLNNSL